MNKLIGISGIVLAIAAPSFILGSQDVAIAQSCNYSAGRAVNGQSVNVDLCSISRASYRSIDFVYYLGSEKVVAQANCERGTWTSFPERQVNRPQSQATQRMMEVVCSYQYAEPSTVAYVFDPPSNVRVSPNGAVLCSIQRPTTISTYGSNGSWYYTDACGSMGMIHSSQIRF